MPDQCDSPWRFGPKPVLGLLGAPGSGKSEVARHFAGLCCAVIDADRLAHEAIQAADVRDQLLGWWGEGVLDASGGVDRAAVGSVVFADRAQLKKLEGLVHPRVHAGRSALRERHMADPAVTAIIEDCPLLLETGLQTQCDRLVFIDCPEPIRLQRLHATRGWDAREAQRRQQHQLPLDTKRRSADYVIDNAASPERVRDEVRGLIEQILRPER